MFGESRAAIARYRAADRALQANGDAEEAAGVNWETDQFHRLNDALWDAARGLPWWWKWVLR
jgi:hypothetical protein